MTLGRGLLTIMALGALGPAGPDRLPPARAYPSSPRTILHQQAARQLLETHLVTSGRGLHLKAPGLIPLFHFFENPLVPVDLDGAVGTYVGANMEGRRAVGMFASSGDGDKVIAVGCVFCHSGRAAGRLIVGLGNKRVDVARLGALGHLLDRTAAYPAVLEDTRWTNRTKGLVPVAPIQHWFYENAGLPTPPEAAAVVKPPHLWGYGEKRKAGLFCDGSGDGSAPGWAAMVELVAGQTPETVRQYRRRLEDIETRAGQLLPPPYPFGVKPATAVRGKAVFEQTCAACHGTYRRDSEGLPVYEAPRIVPWEVAGTDKQRMLSVTPQFRRLVETGPLRDMIRMSGLPPGYLAPRLEGIWARFPYLHNGSVPNIRELLRAPGERPRVFSLWNAGERERFDEAALGLTVPGRGLAQMQLLYEAALGSRDVYRTDQPGQSNQGHAFGTTLDEEDKRALIEYLKTL